jgi:valyl-tRNA synthetase
MNVPAAAVAPLVLVGANAATRHRLTRHESAIKRLARIGEITHAAVAPKGSAQIVINEATVCLPLGELIDLKAEAARLQKEVGKITEEIGRILKKLSNEKFVANAREDVVESERQKLSEFQEAQEKLQAALSRVRAAD